MPAQQLDMGYRLELTEGTSPLTGQENPASYPRWSDSPGSPPRRRYYRALRLSASLLLLLSLAATIGGQYLLTTGKDEALSTFLYGAGLVAFLCCLAAQWLLSPDYRPWRLSARPWHIAWPWPLYRTAVGLLSAILLVVSLATINTMASRITLGAWGLSLLFALLAAVPAGLISRRSLGRRLSMMLARWRTPEAVVVCAIILIGAVMRLYDLAGIPSGIHGDETGEALIALSVLEGKGPNPFGTAFYGDRALYFYLHAPFFILFGKTLTAIRVFSALAGVATLPAFYLLMRRLFGIRPALIALALLAGSAVHINYSRLGLNVVQISLFTIVTLYCLRLGQESRRPFWWLSTGLLAGLTVYFSFGGILVPVTVALYFLYLFITRHSKQGIRTGVPGLRA